MSAMFPRFELTDLTYIANLPHFELRMKVDGVPCYLNEAPDSILFLMGYCYLGPHFDETVPLTVITSDEFYQKLGENRPLKVLTGYTKDPGVLHAQRQLIYDIFSHNFKPGAVPFRAIPDQVLDSMNSSLRSDP